MEGVVFIITQIRWVKFISETVRITTPDPKQSELILVGGFEQDYLMPKTFSIRLWTASMPPAVTAIFAVLVILYIRNETTNSVQL